MRRDTLRARAVAAQKAVQSDAQVRFRLGQIERARLDASRLTRDDTWNTYLEQIEHKNKLDREEIASIRASQMGETGIFMPAEQCQALEHRVSLLSARIQARNECIAIPTGILEPSGS